MTDEETAAARKQERRANPVVDVDCRAFEAWWARFAKEADKFDPKTLAALAFLAGRMALKEEQRDEIRTASHGLPEAGQ